MAKAGRGEGILAFKDASQLDMKPLLPTFQREERKIASDYDLVVTTYQTIAADYSKAGKVGVISIYCNS